MANYSPQEAVNFAREFVKGIPVAAVDFMVADFIQSQIWNFFTWSFTMAEDLKVGNAFIADGSQDLTGAVPTDFYQLIEAKLTRTDLSDGNHYKELTIAKRLPYVDPAIKVPYERHEFVAYVPQLDAFRLQYPILIGDDEETQLDIEYQISPTKITAANIATSFADMPDWFFQIFTDGVMWRFMTLANDKRQGALQISKSGQRSYTGQMGVFYNGLIEQMISEQQAGQDFRYPAEGSLGAKY